ncbi:MAG: prepilin-type N-terminal cleavage/methylation domain-containing protein [Planctomycetes bacterium]|nr:prepilin-type N-terminal cleavage/methylation domain-containing protein [Planctomycetota bacterium]
MRAKSGFTLVEVLIVVVILGILAAVVIPQFSDASTEAKESSVKTNLQLMRSQIALYKIRNSDSLPPTTDFAVFKAAMVPDYIQAIPENLYNSDNTVRFESGASTAGAGTEGWVLNTDTGVFQANDSSEHAAW